MRMIHPKTVKKRLDFRPTKGLKFEPLEESLAMRELYVRGIKHDINGLLSPTISMSDYFASFDDEKAKKMVPAMQRFHRQSKVVLEQVTRLAALMADLQTGKPISILFDPGVEMDRAALSLTYRNGSAKIDISLNHQHEARGNPLDLYRALMNLLINAHDALGQGGRISLESRERSISKVKYLSISVADNGHGMDAKTIEKIFEPGVTFKESGQGLGLFVVQHSIASFGGLIDLESTSGKGTKFTLLIPASVE